MEVERHRGMIANKYITVGCDLYEKVKSFKYLGSLLTKSKFYSRQNKMKT